MSSTKNDQLANRLLTLHHKLEAEKNHSADWRTALLLEERIGAGQNVTEAEVIQAEILLEKYGIV